MNIYKAADKLHKKVKNFILTCVGEDGYPLNKAVVPGKHRNSLNELYFTTNTSSKFAQAIMKNPKGSVYFYHKILMSWKGCTLKGHFEIVDDINLKQKYWRNLFKAAYPEKNYKCPDFCLVKFTPTAGRLYANYTINDFEIKQT